MTKRGRPPRRPSRPAPAKPKKAAKRAKSPPAPAVPRQAAPATPPSFLGDGITKAELVKRFGETPKQIERYVEEGIPCHGSGRARRFPWPAVRHWRDERIRRQERERLAPKSDQPEGLKEAERRTAIADAELKELKLAQLRGTLAPVEDFRREIAGVLARVRMLILRQPDLPAPAADALLRAIQADPPPVEDPALEDVPSVAA